MSSSASSVDSHEYNEHPSCVHETSQDECALNRFLVWAAIKRNACQKMTAEEKKECPLLRCRKRFPSHELMLQHLYTCEQLSSGEYWCYDCARAERFNDAKCKRCLGHPSKRRKVKLLAKNFFSSLGHRSRNGSLLDLDVDDDESPPSYDECLDVLAPPLQAELQANEIHEIDSYELPLTTIMENVAEEECGEQHCQDQRQDQEQRKQQEDFRHESMSSQMSPHYLSPLPPPTIYPVELDSEPHIDEDMLINWEPSPPPQSLTIAPVSLINTQDAKPLLQLHTSTSDLEHYRAQIKRRSKMLAPSSSIRSTASTASTVSTASTASYTISPMSTWSGGWARVPDFESTMTSPADEFAPTNPFGPHKPFDFGCEQIHDNIMGSLSSGLSADLSMLSSGVATNPFGDPPTLFQQTFNHDLDGEARLSFDANLAIVDDSQMAPHVLQPEDSPAEHHRISTHSLVGTAWDALQMHIEESMTRLQRVRSNRLVDQLRTMTPGDIASVGLETAVRVLEGNPVNSPVDILCFVHLVFSFSLVVHEQDAPNRGVGLFSQAVFYASDFSRLDRQAYLPIVDILWKPSGMSDSEVKGLMQKTSTSEGSRSMSAKGKQPQSYASLASSDPLAFVAQFYLDELEYSAINETDRADVQSSELCVQHLKDACFPTHFRSPFSVAVGFIQKLLLQQFADVPRFRTCIDELLHRVNTSYGSTVRRLELELMHAGKMCLSSDVFFDSYIPVVRTHIDSLYAQSALDSSQRLAYHCNGLRLVAFVIDGFTQRTMNTADSVQATPELESIDDLFKSMAPEDEFGFDQVLESTSFAGFVGPVPDIVIDSSSVTPGTTETGPGLSTAATSPPSPETGSKAGSDSCCELCGYRPEGDPRWFPGSMAKHKKLQHATSPPKIYRCLYPGCTSQYRNRPDNLRQHRIKKSHFVDGEDESDRRPCKRKKIE